MSLVEILVLALSLACGYLGGAVRSLVLHRRTLGLEYRVQDLEQRNLTTVNREKAQRRWQKEETMQSDEQAFLESLKGSKSNSERFANDGPSPFLP